MTNCNAEVLKVNVEDFLKIIGSDFFAGVPDSQLKALCSYLTYTYGNDPKHHVIAANEGNCTALAAGYYLATNKIPVVYMQNSGEGNAINPIASLLNDKVYAIPMIFVIGWRGEPGVHDEPQHIYQGEVTIRLLDTMGIASFVVDKNTSIAEITSAMEYFKTLLAKGKNVAFVIKKDALIFKNKIEYKNNNKLVREEVIKQIVKVSGTDPIVSTTGKISRELFEIREAFGQSHKYDFLTVGSMGHASSIALGIAINKPNVKTWCIDGDGAALMHMGAMAVNGSISCANFVHVLLNNEAHESVGGMPTVANKINFVNIARACGYSYAVSVDNFDTLNEELNKIKNHSGCSFIEIKCAIGSRADLGRPTTTAKENKENFMEYLKEI